MTTIAQRLVMYPGGRVRVEEQELTAPGPGQMLVRVTRSQISAGSEMNQRESLDRRGSGSAAPGYTTAGRVVEVGPDVERFRPGDRVLCFGHHASHVLVDLSDAGEWTAHPDPLPEGVSDEQACFGPLGDIALHGVRRAQLQIDQSVAVFGAGVVGQMTVQFARLSGAHPIVAVDLVDSRLEAARRSGATHAVNASREDGATAIRTHTGSAGAQAVFHCSRNPQVLQTAMEAAADRGTVVVTASAPGKATIGLQVELLRRELTVLGVYESTPTLMAPHVYWPWTRQRNRAAIYRLIGEGRVRVDQLVSHVVPPSRAEEMYAMIAAGGEGWMSVLFDWE